MQFLLDLPTKLTALMCLSTNHSFWPKCEKSRCISESTAFSLKLNILTNKKIILHINLGVL